MQLLRSLAALEMFLVDFEFEPRCFTRFNDDGPAGLVTDVRLAHDGRAGPRGHFWARQQCLSRKYLSRRKAPPAPDERRQTARRKSARPPSAGRGGCPRRLQSGSWERLRQKVAFALSVKRVIDDELTVEDFVVAQAERAESERDPAQTFSGWMRIYGVRVSSANDFAKLHERGVSQFVRAAKATENGLKKRLEFSCTSPAQLCNSLIISGVGEGNRTLVPGLSFEGGGGRFSTNA